MTWFLLGATSDVMAGTVAPGTAGSSTRKRAPVSPGTGSTSPIRPPCRSVTQRAIASPSPVPPPGGSGSVPKRSKTRSRSSGAMPGALVGDLEPDDVADAAGRDPHDAAGRAVPGSVVEQVGEQLVQAGAVGVHDQVGGLDPDVEGHAARTRAAPRRRASSTRAATGTSLRSSGDHAGVDPGEVEQVADQVAQPLGLAQGHRDRRRVGLGHAVVEVLQHGDQCGERRTQLVGDARDQVASLRGRPWRGRPPSG